LTKIFKMSKPAVVLFLSTFITVSSFGQFSPRHYALRDVSVIDLVAKKVLGHCTIIIHENLIEKVGPVKEITIPDSVVVFNYSGKYVMPGLIDTHEHIATDPSNDDSRARAEKDLKSMLLSGVTSIRDMAGDARALASLSRDAKLDNIVSPDIYYTALMAGPAFFVDPRTHLTTQGGVAGDMPYMKAVTDSTDLAIAIAEAKGSGATAIKLYADISGELAKKITAEAHRQQMLVWSHANLQYASPLEVINAGVNSVSHAAMMSGWSSRTAPVQCRQPCSAAFWDSVFKTFPVVEIIAAMRKNKTVLDATVLIYKEAGEDTSLPMKQRLSWAAMYEMGKRFTKVAGKAGIPVSTGMDMDANKIVLREMKLLIQECGFTPMEVLVSATVNGALATGIEKTTGTVEAGKFANLIILSADPSVDINNLDNAEVVIKNGKMFNTNK
jgi:imidazolonepropionase-like amidohydrolase